MAAGLSVDQDLLGWMRQRLEQASPDLLRDMVQLFAGMLMDADTEALCNAGYRQRSGERVSQPAPCDRSVGASSGGAAE